MTFTAVYRDIKANAWVAIWRTLNGNCIHERLPRTVLGRQHAEAYALGNPPSW